MPIRRRNHDLCICLNDSAKSLDPGTYAKLPVRAGLLRLGFPPVLAEVLSATTAFGVKQILVALPQAQLAKTLRVMIPLVCPDLDVCPARVEVLKTYAGPTLGAELKALVAGLR
ncbi:hypothetical protein [Amycolatopsis sp. NPDC004378]